MPTSTIRRGKRPGAKIRNPGVQNIEPLERRVLLAALVEIDMQAASDLGWSSTDNATCDNTPTFDVTVNGAGTIELDFNGDLTVDETRVVSSAGTYEFTPASPIPDGGYRNYGGTDNRLRAVFTNGLGDPAATAYIEDMSINATPMQPVTIDLQTASDTGISDSDNITSDNTPTFDFTLDGGLPPVWSLDWTGDGKSDMFPILGQDKQSVNVSGSRGTFEYRYDLTWIPSGVGNDGGRVTAEGDFNNDGFPDLAFAEASGDAIAIAIGRGDGSFGLWDRLPVGGDPMAIVSSDFNADGNADIAVTNSQGCAVQTLIGNGDATFQSLPAIPVGSTPGDLLNADFNNDGIQDLAVCIPSAGQVSVLLGIGNGFFHSPVAYDTGWGNAIFKLEAADFSGDGADDLAGLDCRGFVHILTSNGDGTLSPGAIASCGAWPTDFRSADFNKDGSADVTVGSYDAVDVLLGNGDGTFQDRVTYSGFGSVNGVVCEDFDGDGNADISVGGKGYVLFGHGDGSFGLFDTTSGGGWLGYGLASDLDQDGVVDLVGAAGGWTYLFEGNSGVLPDGNYSFTLTAMSPYGTTSSANLHVTIDTTPPKITGWQIVGTHGGGVGEIVTNIADGYVEPRNQGVRQLRIAFNEDIADNLTPADLSIVGVSNGDQNGLISSVSVAGNILTVELSVPLPDKDRYTLTLGPNAQDIAGNNATGDLDLQIVALKGDANGDGMVNSFDLLNIRVYVGQALNAARARYDINGDGAINSFDLLMARVYVGYKVT